MTTNICILLLIAKGHIHIATYNNMQRATDYSCIPGGGGSEVRGRYVLTLHMNLLITITCLFEYLLLSGVLGNFHNKLLTIP